MTALKYACVSFLVLLCFSFSIAHKFLFDTNDQKLGDFRHGSSHVGGAGKRYGVWWRIEWRLVLPGDLLLNYGYGIGRGDGGSGHSTVPGIGRGFGQLSIGYTTSSERHPRGRSGSKANDEPDSETQT
uniref:Secreted protein n=1 Tax=Populus alba TaxID=43335 RepID=A0A4U5P414_POPAL|nr:hypothetical protein D5086_0000235080 [Populus alba]